MEYQYLVHGELHRIRLEEREGKIVANLKGKQLELDVYHVSPQVVSLLANGKSYLARVARHGKKIFVAIGANHFCLEVPDQRDSMRFKGGTSGKAEGTIRAPMPGMVIKVNVAEGSEVNPGDSLAVVEAMKMEHEMRATSKAVVGKVYVKAGQQVDAFQPLVELNLLQE
jgi:propionyl-CoA carboxylase alpha chain